MGSLHVNRCGGPLGVSRGFGDRGALDLDVVSVTKIAAMLETATENTLLSRCGRPPRWPPARFARDSPEYRTSASKAKSDAMTIIDGGALNTSAQEELR